MAMNWSDEQKLAIYNGGHNILVSAGAGSGGKTAVLSERIYQLVKKGNAITRFLVLTFTNAAAMEMKSRVRDKILKDEELAHLAPDIENAHIETFDAFCLFLVKKYAAVLNISPSIVVIDQTILSIQESKIVDAIFKNWYLSKDPLFEELIVKFSIKNDDRLKTLVKDIIRLANLQLDKEKFFKEFDETYLKENFIKDLIDEEYKNSIKTLEGLLPYCAQLELTHDQTRYIFETRTVGLDDANETVRVDDIIETINHFSMIDRVIEFANYELSEAFIKELHKILKTGTSDSRLPWFAVGDYKKRANIVGDKKTISPRLVSQEMKKLVDEYNKKDTHSFEEIVEFHVKFEKIHPFYKQKIIFSFLMCE